MFIIRCCKQFFANFTGEKESFPKTENQGEPKPKSVHWEKDVAKYAPVEKNTAIFERDVESNECVCDSDILLDHNVNLDLSNVPELSDVSDDDEKPEVVPNEILDKEIQENLQEKLENENLEEILQENRENENLGEKIKEEFLGEILENENLEDEKIEEKIEEILDNEKIEEEMDNEKIEEKIEDEKIEDEKIEENENILL